MSRYGISRKLECGYDEAVAKARSALAKEGFGVLTEIDVAATLKKKLGKEFRKYIILGACNPPLAHKALTVETEVGLLLPCNVIVYENDENGVTVSAIDPMVAMSMIENPALALVAKDVKELLEKVINGL